MGCMITFLIGKIKLHKQKSKQTNILLPTLLPNLFTYGLQMLMSFEEYPKRDSRLGFYNNQKMKERGEGLNPFLDRLKIEEILGLFGQHLSFTCA